jgi:hypothetical protein
VLREYLNVIFIEVFYYCRGFKVFYNRRYFLKFRKYSKGSRGALSPGSS